MIDVVNLPQPVLTNRFGRIIRHAYTVVVADFPAISTGLAAPRASGYAVNSPP